MHFETTCDHNKYVKNIPGKTLILIGALITLTVVLLGIAIWAGGKSGKSAVTIAPTPTVVKTATISFAPNILDLSLPTTSSATVDMVTSTGVNPITGVQVDVVYDPTVITNVKLLPPVAASSLFGPAGNYITLFSDTKILGKVSFAVAINPTGTPVTGTGSIGQITFTVIKNLKPQTQMIFGAGTIVTSKAVQTSVLNTTTPLTIKLQ